MAWEAISKDEVAKLSGIKSTDLRDEWYLMAVDVIKRFAGINNIGATVSVTETRDGNGSRVIQVYKPPITAVASVTINGTAVPASLIDFSRSAIYIKDPTSLTSNGTEYSIFFDEFEEGSRNVVLTYTSGTVAVDHSVSLAIALIVKELANVYTAEGAESRIQFYRPGRSEATEDPLIHWGIHGIIEGIVNTILGRKVRIS